MESPGLSSSLCSVVLSMLAMQSNMCRDANGRIRSERGCDLRWTRDATAKPGLIPQPPSTNIDNIHFILTFHVHMRRDIFIIIRSEQYPYWSLGALLTGITRADRPVLEDKETVSRPIGRAIAKRNRWHVTGFSPHLDNHCCPTPTGMHHLQPYSFDGIDLQTRTTAAGAHRWRTFGPQTAQDARSQTQPWKNGRSARLMK